MKRTCRGLVWVWLVGCVVLGGCGPSSIDPDDVSGDPRLTARPGPPSVGPALGESALGLGGGRDGLLFVPSAYDAGSPVPLLVVLHGAGGDAQGMRWFGDMADEWGMAVLIPESRGGTWDLVRGGFGPDVAFIDRALEHTFRRVRVDPQHVALAGFSDGASYALSLGVSNGALFTHLVAFSPGFLTAAEPIVGKPLVFVSHGEADTVLPLQLSRDRIVPGLRNAGYDVTYRQFEGGHGIPEEIARAALDWFLG